MTTDVKPKPGDPKYIGLICRVLRVKKLSEYIFLWMYRAMAMETELIRHGYNIFCYATADVDPKTMTVQGNIFKDNEFEKITLPIPQVNLDWLIGSVPLEGKPGFHYSHYEPWALKHGIEIYPTREFRHLANDKYASYNAVIECDATVAPYTELFENSVFQFASFLDKGNCVFIKPRWGRMGNDIFVLKKDEDFYSIDHYQDKMKTNVRFQDIADVVLHLKQRTDKGHYVIQCGVKTIRYKDSAFDVRVIMLNDGFKWHSVSEIRVGVKYSDLSNVSQGGRNLETAEVLSVCLPGNRGESILKKILAVSKKLAEHFTQESSYLLNEFAIDYIIDEKEDVYIAELNAKPGLSGMPDLFGDFFNMTDHERRIYEDYTLAHGRYLAQFLIKKYVEK